MWTYRCTVVRVVDGDTVDVSIDLGFGVHKIERVRLAGIDTPERGQPGWAEAGDYLRAWLDQRADGLVLQSRRPSPRDKYGRYLAWILTDGETVNDALIAAGHARPVYT